MTTPAVDYKSTILLPKTDFPMKADLPAREPRFLARWQAEGVYAQILQARKGRPAFILHDGPPFANGDPHIGHLLNIALKDFVLKSKNMAGFYAPFIPGWDCHGLPIEHKVVKDLGANPDDPIDIRQKSEQLARKYIAIQSEQFQRVGVFGDWEHPYLTLDPGYEAEILRVFAGLVEKELVYQGLRPVHWSTGCQTALAEAEIEYQPRIDPAIFVKFPITRDQSKSSPKSKTSLLVWTTTPWTLPANLAVAVSPHLKYDFYKLGDEYVVCAVDLAAKVPGLENAAPSGAPILGNGLEGWEYRHPFLDRTGRIYLADFVTSDAGTGLVHVAPGHGQDDYHLGQSAGLGILSPVDDRGCLTAECGVPELVGQYVFKANPLVIDLLKTKGALFGEPQQYEHDYPHCWRSKTPIVFRAVKQWFIKVDAFRAQTLAAIEKVNWIPSWGKNRIRGAVENRPDWCISRQRTWGVPIPVFYGEGEQPLLSAKVARKFADLVESEGAGIWFVGSDDAVAARLGLPLGLRKGRDTLDVWIDSGSSHAAVLRKRLTFPADMYLEGSDQHRGWFQSSLSLSVALTGEPPFRQVLTHGFIVDGAGKKFSKSSGAIDLATLVGQSGADVLRLWVASLDYREDAPFSKDILARVADAYRSIRNTLRILLANLAGFDPARHEIKAENLTELDRYVDGRLQELIAGCREAYERFEFHQVYHLINRFCAVDLSALYIDVLKDRLYCDAADDPRRRAAQTVCRNILESLIKLLAPLIPFTAEEAWESLGGKFSVHLEEFPAVGPAPAPEFAARWSSLLALRGVINEKLEQARQKKEIGKSLEAEVELSAPGVGEGDADLLAELSIVSRVLIKPASGPDARVDVRRASGKKCVRCWKVLPETGSDPGHPDLCLRCARVVTNLAS